ncbi:11427_t:CDS:2, partial [Acaulospora colombiana]
MTFRHQFPQCSISAPLIASEDSRRLSQSNMAYDIFFETPVPRALARAVYPYGIPPFGKSASGRDLDWGGSLSEQAPQDMPNMTDLTIITSSGVVLLSGALSDSLAAEATPSSDIGMLPDARTSGLSYHLRGGVSPHQVTGQAKEHLRYLQDPYETRCREIQQRPIGSCPTSVSTSK